MIRIALRNLISNAVKFAKPGTEVRIKGETNKEYLEIQISNEGIPIPAKEAEKLFTYQMPSSEGTAGERGTGLGLAMTAYFIRVNGGNISYTPTRDSSVTTFVVKLPRKGADRPQESRSSTVSPL